MQYKTICLPAYSYGNVSKNEFRKGLSQTTCQKIYQAVNDAIMREANAGWILHSTSYIPQNIKRKKTIFEVLLGWIPLLNKLLFPSMFVECFQGYENYMHVLVFVRN